MIRRLLVALAAAAVLLSFLPDVADAWPRGRFNADNVALRRMPNLNSPANGWGALNQVTCIYYVSGGQEIPGNRFWFSNGNENRNGFTPEMKLDWYIQGTCPEPR